MGSSAGTWVEIANVQLELGSVATPFEQRPVGLELSLCQRYYQTTVDGATDRRGFFGFGGTVNPTQAQGSALFKVDMRVTPSVVITGSDIHGVAPLTNPVATIILKSGFYRILNDTDIAGKIITAGYTADAEL